MLIGQFLTAMFGGGVLLALVWVAFWTIMAPLIFSGWTWAGHEALTDNVFYVGAIAGFIGILLSTLKR